MSKNKRFFVIILCIAISGSICNLFLIGCNKRENQPESQVFYSLEEVYDNGWLSENDLITIADYHNNGKNYPEGLNVSVENSIKEKAAERLRNDSTYAPDGIEQVSAEDFYVSKYYGTYNELAIVLVGCTLFHYTEEFNPISIKIGEIALNFGHPRYIKSLIAWKV